VLDDHAIAQWLQIHEKTPPNNCWQFWHPSASTDQISRLKRGVQEAGLRFWVLPERRTGRENCRT
jgi:hypothetical protein